MSELLPITISTPEQGEALWGLGGLWIIKVPAAATGGSFCLLEVRMNRGVATPLHNHPADDETFIVVHGHLALLVDGRRVDAHPGAVVHVPGGHEHAWRVESETAVFQIIATAQHEDFYRAASRPASGFVQPPDAGVVDLGVIVPAGEAHGVQIIAPPPSY